MCVHAPYTHKNICISHKEAVTRKATTFIHFCGKPHVSVNGDCSQSQAAVELLMMMMVSHRNGMTKVKVENLFLFRYGKGCLIWFVCTSSDNRNGCA